MRVLDVVEVLGALDFPAPLHCQCDLNTDHTEKTASVFYR